MTGGSDFHGSVKPSIPLGASWIDENLFFPLVPTFFEKPMTYAALLHKLFQINLFVGSKLGLTNMQRMLEKLDHPEKKFKSVHVAGTNGKGSTTTKIAKGLEAAGLRVGLYTSPHISCFRERIQINGTLIPESYLEKTLPKLFDVCTQNSIAATFFELTTALAFCYFADERVDFASIETGLGGRSDATNVIIPEASVITSIALEHTDILGDTLEKITIEKAGIAKPGVPLVIGPDRTKSRCRAHRAQQKLPSDLRFRHFPAIRPGKSSRC